MKTAIISGCDNNYFNQFLNLYNSLIDTNCLDYADLCFVNISVSNENLKKISDKTKKIIEPKWDYNFSFPTKEWKKILTIRPFLKNYFPGYENYIWLDADTWVQGNKFINDFASVAKTGKMSIVPELDINYETKRKKYSFKKLFYNIYQSKGWSYKNFKKYFDKQSFTKLFQKPILNAGVFSIPKESVIWDKWADEYGQIVERSSDDYCLNMDQASLNKIIYNNLDLVNFFNVEYNYLIKNSMPLINNDNKFCLKDFPNKKIEILHLTSIIFDQLYELESIHGKKIKRKLSYEIR
jgi:lipopolysaccharide biosynthesis glycosyltransferase